MRQVATVLILSGENFKRFISIEPHRIIHWDYVLIIRCTGSLIANLPQLIFTPDS